jgi:tetratricopeptide (TPR) repeat protein
MPLTNDRRSLQRLEAETERVIGDIRSQDDPSLLSRYARELGTLGEIRARLGRSDEAERLFDEAARVALALHSASDTEFAAATRIRQSTLALADGRHDQALSIIEDMIADLGGFPKLDGVPGGPATGLQIWLTLLQLVGDTQRLYEASSVALALLSPPVSREARVAMLRASVYRARGAEALGYANEAIEMCKQAIALADRVTPPLVDDELLDNAIVSLPGLLRHAGRDHELPDAYAQIVSRLASSKRLVSRLAVRAARLWLRADRRH